MNSCNIQWIQFDYDALDIRVTGTNDGIEMKAYIPSELITISKNEVPCINPGYSEN